MGPHETSGRGPCSAVRTHCLEISEGRRRRKPEASHSSEKLTNLLETVPVLFFFFCLHREFCKNVCVVKSFEILFWKFTLEMDARWILRMCIYS